MSISLQSIPSLSPIIPLRKFLQTSQLEKLLIKECFMNKKISSKLFKEMAAFNDCRHMEYIK